MGVAFERVKQFKDLMVDYDAPAGGTVNVYTDMPGATMDLRKSYNLPATTGRQTRNVPLDGATTGTYIEGTLLRVEFIAPADGTLIPYAATVRMRPIGVYLDGSNGEVWSTQAMGFGI